MGKKKSNSDVLVFFGCFLLVIAFVILIVVILVAPDGDGKTTETTFAPAEIVSIAEVKTGYDKNTLSADDLYKGNRYRFTGTLYSIDDTDYWDLYSSDGLFADIVMDELTEETITCCVIVTEGENNYFLWCIFSSETQRDALTQVAVGDTVTFEGTCVDWGNWHDCVLIESRAAESSAAHPSEENIT